MVTDIEWIIGSIRIPCCKNTKVFITVWCVPVSDIRGHRCWGCKLAPPIWIGVASVRGDKIKTGFIRTAVEVRLVNSLTAPGVQVGI